MLVVDYSVITGWLAGWLDDWLVAAALAMRRQGGQASCYSCVGDELFVLL